MADNDRQLRGTHLHPSTSGSSSKTHSRNQTLSKQSSTQPSDRTKKLSRRASAEQTETLRNSLNCTLTEAADKQCTNTERLTPRALRYSRRSGGLVEPDSQPNKKTNSSTVKSSAASHNAQVSVGTSTATDLRGQSGRKRRSTEAATSETPSKKLKKESSQSKSSRTSSSYKPKQESAPKKQAVPRRSSKSTVVRQQTSRRASNKTSNLERGKEKAAKGDKASAKATAGHPSVGATAAGHIPIKKRLQRSTATATAGAEASSNIATGATATTACTSQSSRTVTRRAATKRGGTLLTSSSHLTDTTGSCASSKRRSAVGKHSAAAGSGVSTTESTASGLKLSAMSSSGHDDATPDAPSTGASAAAPTASAGALVDDAVVNPDGASVESGAVSTAAASAVPSSFASLIPSLDQDSNDVGRLQALLEARGLPSHLFGALGPRMHQLLLRSSMSGSVSKAQQLLQGLQSKDEAQQVAAVTEMCQLLVMGNEDTLAGFPIKQVVPVLITLLQMEHNFDIMHHACRALTYMMEALPRSSAVVVDAVPVFLEKLQAIQCMDVAEQALQALEMLSKKHNKAILHANGVLACLTYVDFFSMPAQRHALAVTANCCQNLTPDDFHYIQDSLPLLSARLTSHDKKSLESVCLCMARLVDNYHMDEKIMKEIASHELMVNVQQLLMASPQVLSTGVFVTVLRMLVIMCASCPDLAVMLLKQNVAETLCYLLIGPDQAGASQSIELVQRTPQELFEIVSLIGELMPKLPTDGLFAIDSMLRKSSSQPTDCVVWQWLDDHGMWHPYSIIDSRIVEAAHQSGEHEVNLSIFGGNYTVDFETMQQINDDTGTARHVQRKVNPLAVTSTVVKVSMTKSDSREDILHEDTNLASAFIKTLFGVLYEVYSSAAGPSVRHKCLQAIMRMIYYASAELLQSVLTSSNVSSHVAAMMASPDLKIVVASIQMAYILMEKLPDVFGVYFCREGVMHQVKKLCEPDVIDLSSKKTETATSATESVSDVSLASSGADTPSTTTGAAMADKRPSDSGVPSAAAGHPDNSRQSCTVAPSGSSPRMRLSSVLKHKKPPKRGGRKSSKSDPVASSSSDSMEPYSSLADPYSGLGRSSMAAELTPPLPRGKWSSGGKSFLAGFHPSRWGRASSTGPERPTPHTPPQMGLSQMYHEAVMGHQHHLPPPQSCSSATFVDNREKVKHWISEQASSFCEKYYGEDSRGASHLARTNLSKLCTALSSLNNPASRGEDTVSLKHVAAIVSDTDMSPFEIIHSGLVTALMSYLTVSDVTQRDSRLRKFLRTFLSLPADESKTSLDIASCNARPYSSLVMKLINCFHHLEQFQVKVHDLPGGSGTSGRSSNALKFFDTHQLKCNLQRHASCTNLKQWHGGPVKIDPLALVQAIERYLVMRGYGRIRQNADNDCSDDDDASDDDIDDTMAAMSISHGSGRHRIELLIGDHVLPYSMTVYEAVKQFSRTHEHEGTDTDTDSEMLFGSASIWINTHTIWFRAATDTGRQPESSVSPKKTKSERRRSNNSKLMRGGNMSSDAIVACSVSALEAFLTSSLPAHVTIKDPSLDVLALLRLLQGLSYHWHTLFDKALGTPLLSQQEFVSSKLMAKVSRQLQDPLVIMTGNMPQWLSQIGQACPFLLPFDTRLALFYATSFDRDRAMHRLQDASHENAPSDSAERVAPRLERKKSVISRDDILKQADKVISDLGASRAILEIQYENEVGTGLGPTLEFYALVSREMQNVDLELWRGEPVKRNELRDDGHTYVFSATGLFPAPLARNAKMSHVNKIKSKFRFLGKFMAKALMDSRMLDLPLSEVFYKWMLGQEHTLQADDLRHICPIFAKSFVQLTDVLQQKKRIEADKSHTADSRQLALSSLTLSGGGTIEDLDLDFVLPGYSSIELKKGGKDIHVTLDNLEEYLKLVTQWTLVDGVHRQFEAFREGFESLFPLSTLRLFYPDELDQLFCGSSFEPWSVKYLMETCRPDHGYTLDSPTIKCLFEILATYSASEQRLFLQFMTGSPRLPVGGLRSLNPPLTIVRKTVETTENADDFLPSVMTCVNYLKLPEYSSNDVMRTRLAVAAREGQLSFHLS